MHGNFDYIKSLYPELRLLLHFHQRFLHHTHVHLFLIMKTGLQLRRKRQLVVYAAA
jgi:hypothetical protein